MSADFEVCAFTAVRARRIAQRLRVRRHRRVSAAEPTTKGPADSLLPPSSNNTARHPMIRPLRRGAAACAAASPGLRCRRSRGTAAPHSCHRKVRAAAAAAGRRARRLPAAGATTAAPSTFLVEQNCSTIQTSLLHETSAALQHGKAKGRAQRCELHQSRLSVTM